MFNNKIYRVKCDCGFDCSVITGLVDIAPHFCPNCGSSCCVTVFRDENFERAIKSMIIKYKLDTQEHHV